MKTIAVPCDVDGKKVPIQFHVGDPQPSAHPIGHQANWLAKERGVYVPQDVMESMDTIHQTAKELNIPFEEIVTFALERALQMKAAGSSSSDEENKDNN